MSFRRWIQWTLIAMNLWTSRAAATTCRSAPLDVLCGTAALACDDSGTGPVCVCPGTHSYVTTYGPDSLPSACASRDPTLIWQYDGQPGTTPIPDENHRFDDEPTNAELARQAIAGRLTEPVTASTWEARSQDMCRLCGLAAIGYEVVVYRYRAKGTNIGNGIVHVPPMHQWWDKNGSQWARGPVHTGRDWMGGGERPDTWLALVRCRCRHPRTSETFQVWGDQVAQRQHTCDTWVDPPRYFTTVTLDQQGKEDLAALCGDNATETLYSIPQTGYQVQGIQEVQDGSFLTRTYGPHMVLTQMCRCRITATLAVSLVFDPMRSPHRPHCSWVTDSTESTRTLALARQRACYEVSNITTNPPTSVPMDCLSPDIPRCGAGTDRAVVICPYDVLGVGVVAGPMFLDTQICSVQCHCRHDSPVVPAGDRTYIEAPCDAYERPCTARDIQTFCGHAGGRAFDACRLMVSVTDQVNRFLVPGSCVQLNTSDRPDVPAVPDQVVGPCLREGLFRDCRADGQCLRTCTLGCNPAVILLHQCGPFALGCRRTCPEAPPNMTGCEETCLCRPEDTLRTYYPDTNQPAFGYTHLDACGRWPMTVYSKFASALDDTVTTSDLTETVIGSFGPISGFQLMRYAMQKHINGPSNGYRLDLNRGNLNVPATIALFESPTSMCGDRATGFELVDYRADRQLQAWVPGRGREETMLTHYMDQRSWTDIADQSHGGIVSFGTHTTPRQPPSSVSGMSDVNAIHLMFLRCHCHASGASREPYSVTSDNLTTMTELYRRNRLLFSCDTLYTEGMTGDPTAPAFTRCPMHAYRPCNDRGVCNAAASSCTCAFPWDGVACASLARDSISVSKPVSYYTRRTTGCPGTSCRFLDPCPAPCATAVNDTGCQCPPAWRSKFVATSQSWELRSRCGPDEGVGEQDGCAPLGTCVGPGECECSPPHFGPLCALSLCGGQSEAYPKGCSGHGRCVLLPATVSSATSRASPLTGCVCDPPAVVGGQPLWTGDICSVMWCHDQCMPGKGTCELDRSTNVPECVCRTGWYGVYCQHSYYPLDTNGVVCGNHVLNRDEPVDTITGDCRCSQGWAGTVCETRLDDPSVCGTTVGRCSRAGDCRPAIMHRPVHGEVGWACRCTDPLVQGQRCFESICPVHGRQPCNNNGVSWMRTCTSDGACRCHDTRTAARVEDAHWRIPARMGASGTIHQRLLQSAPGHIMIGAACHVDAFLGCADYPGPPIGTGVGMKWDIVSLCGGSSEGTCVATNATHTECVCAPGRIRVEFGASHRCSTHDCSAPCFHGHCTPGEHGGCVCQELWRGPACNESTCMDSNGLVPRRDPVTGLWTCGCPDALRRPPACTTLKCPATPETGIECGGDGLFTQLRFPYAPVVMAHLGSSIHGIGCNRTVGICSCLPATLYMQPSTPLQLCHPLFDPRHTVSIVAENQLLLHSPLTFTCDLGWDAASMCTTKLCANGGVSSRPGRMSPSTCPPHTTLASPPDGDCCCPSEWTGDHCQTPRVSPMCGLHSNRVGAHCKCIFPWAAVDPLGSERVCPLSRCPPNRSTTVAAAEDGWQCACLFPWNGSDVLCGQHLCVGDSVPTDTECRCLDSRFTGPTCSLVAPPSPAPPTPPPIPDTPVPTVSPTASSPVRPTTSPTHQPSAMVPLVPPTAEPSLSPTTGEPTTVPESRSPTRGSPGTDTGCLNNAVQVYNATSASMDCICKGGPHFPGTIYTGERCGQIACIGTPLIHWNETEHICVPTGRSARRVDAFFPGKWWGMAMLWLLIAVQDH